MERDRNFNGRRLSNKIRRRGGNGAIPMAPEQRKGLAALIQHKFQRSYREIILIAITAKAVGRSVPERICPLAVEYIQ
jgi:hypothetical protein